MSKRTQIPPAKWIGTGKKADQYFENLVTILLTHHTTPSKNQNLMAPRQVAPHIWAWDRTLCIIHPPTQKSRQNFFAEFEDSCDNLQERFENRRTINRLIVALPHAAPDTPPIETCPQNLRACLTRTCKAEYWDAATLEEMVKEIPPLALNYAPTILSDHAERLKNLRAKKRQYMRELGKLCGRIQFVGISVYKEETSSSVPIEDIYIPLQVVSEASQEERDDEKINPLTPG